MPRCIVHACELPALCRPVLVVHDEERGRAAARVDLPLVLCFRHGRRGSVDRYLSRASVKRLDREFRARGVRIDWSRSGVELSWSSLVSERLAEPAAGTVGT